MKEQAKDINIIHFSRYRRIYAAISLTVIGLGLLAILAWRYPFSIDFTGGSVVIYTTRGGAINESVVQKAIAKEKLSLVSQTITGNTVNMQLKPIDEKQEEALRKEIETSGKVVIVVEKFETVGPTIGAEAIKKTLVASALAMLGIMAYMTYSFKKVNYAIAAIVALIHDILVVLGVYAIIAHFTGAQFDTLLVTALLTTMSFSVHDTIVIFDKIREYNRTGKGGTTIEERADRALSETMVRSINNSVTIMIMLLALVLLGGFTIKYFAVALLIGTVTGVYSSPFVATPVLVWLEKRKMKK